MKPAKEKKKEQERQAEGFDEELNENGESVSEAEAGESVEEPPVQEVKTDAQRYNELFDRYQRSLAEFDNFRKRTLKEKAAIFDDSLREIIEKLLPVIDNFERALQSSDDSGSKFHQGIEMIARQLGAFLSELGIEAIEAEPGGEFNHNLHYAVAHVEDGSLGANVIMDVLQKGYKHKEKIIRPSMVRVAN